MSLTEADALLAKVERAQQRRIGEAKAVAAESKRHAADVARLEATARACGEAVGVLNSFASDRASEAQRIVEGLVTQGLRATFGGDMEFHVRTATKANRSEAEFVVSSTVGSDRVETSVMDARGGGVAAVAGFLLRLIVLLLRKDVRRTLFLDEPFAHVSEEYQLPVAEFVRELVDRTDVQVVLVTHADPETWAGLADRTYRSSIDGGWTKLEEI